MSEQAVPLVIVEGRGCEPPSEEQSMPREGRLSKTACVCMRIHWAVSYVLRAEQCYNGHRSAAR